MARKEVLVFVTLILVICCVFGCARKDAVQDSPVVIKIAFWGGPEDINIINDTIEGWQKSHPHIRAKLEHTPYRGYADKLLTRIAGGGAPDIICTEVDLFVTFQSKNVLLDLTPYVQKDREFNFSDFFPEVIDRFTVDNKLYCVPRDTAPFACVFYNKKVFDESGVPYPADDWDWNGLLDTARRLTAYDKNGRVATYGFYAWAWQNFVYSNGGSLVDNVKKPTRCLLDQPAAVEGLQFYTDLIHKYKVAPSPIAMSNLAMGVHTMFATGRLAMFASGIWETPSFRRIEGLEWDVAMFPKGPTGIRAFGTGGSGYCVLKSTKHPEEAWEVIKALSGKNGQVMLAEKGLAQPALRSIAEGPHWATSPKPPANKGMLNEAVKYVTYDPFHSAWRQAKELYINPELDLIFNGQETAEEGTKKFIGKVNKLLKQN